jgi:hypothetical protein
MSKPLPTHLQAIIGRETGERLADVEFVKVFIADLRHPLPDDNNQRLARLGTFSSNFKALKRLCIRHELGIDPILKFEKVVISERFARGESLNLEAESKFIDKAYLDTLKAKVAKISAQGKRDPYIFPRELLVFLGWLENVVEPTVEARQPPLRQQEPTIQAEKPNPKADAQPEDAAVLNIDEVKRLKPQTKAERLKNRRRFVAEEYAKLQQTNISYKDCLKSLQAACLENNHGEVCARTIENDLKWLKDNPGKLAQK